MNNSKDLWLHANYYYYSMNFNVSCISNIKNKYNQFDKNINKTPNHTWIYLVNNRQEKDIFKSYSWQDATGVGVILGYEKLRALDIDGCNDIDFIKKILRILKLPENYEWVTKTGSNNGFHIIFYCDQHIFFKIHPNVSFLCNCQNIGIFEKLELRWIGNLVLPPSYSDKYKFLYDEIPQNIPQKVRASSVDFVVESNCIINFEKSYNSCGEYDYEIQNIEKAEEFSVDIIHSQILDDFSSKDNQFKGYVVIDTETNGLPIDFTSSVQDGNWPRLIQLAYAIFDREGNLLIKKDFYISPNDFEVKREILELTNITTERLIKYGVPLQIALKQFIFDTHNVEFIIGHNIVYDIKVIMAEYHRLDISYPYDKKLICTMKSCQNLSHLNNALNGKYPKLTELYKLLFEDDLTNSHNAMKDVLATNKCYRELVRLMKTPGTN